MLIRNLVPLLLSKPTFSLTPVANGVITSSNTTFTFTDQNFGPSHRTRVLAVMFTDRQSAGTQIANSVLIGNFPAIKAIGVLSSTAVGAEIWYARAPSGGRGNVSITLAGANDRMGMQLYSIIGAANAAPSATGSSAANAGTATLIVPPGGAVIGGAMSLTGGPGTPTSTPSGFNNLDLNNNIAGTQQVFAFHSNAGAIIGSQALTMTLSGGVGSAASVFAAWGP